MRITDIAPTKRGRYSIFIDGEFYGVLHPDIYILSHARIDNDISQKDLDEYIKKSQEIIAKERALKLLSARSYTSKGLFEKLAPYASEEISCAVVNRMEEIGLIDDRDYARRYASDCINLKGYSHSHTKYKLLEKGISRDIADETVVNMGTEDSQWLIFSYIRKKHLGHLGNEKGENRIISSLQRRGFRYGDIRLVIDNLNEDIDYYNNYKDF